MTPRISIIVAMAKNRAIGVNNTLPWHCPEDLKHFKSLTLGHHIIMGRKTYESIGKPLPGRTTIVVSRDRSLKIEGCIVTDSLPAALAACANDDHIFIVGGADIYAQSIQLTNTLIITEVQKDVAGDAWFPEFDRAAWQEVSREIHHQKIPETLEFHFVEYLRSKI